MTAQELNQQLNYAYGGGKAFGYLRCNRYIVEYVNERLRSSSKGKYTIIRPDGSINFTKVTDAELVLGYDIGVYNGSSYSPEYAMRFEVFETGQ